MRRRPKNQDLEALLGSPVLMVWCVFIVTIPFYIFESGLPQPGNLLSLTLLPFAFKHKRLLSPNLRRTFRALANFVIWVCVVNFGWALVLGKWGIEYTVFPFYYLFNLAVFFIAFVAYQRYGELFVRLTLYCVLVAVFAQVAASILFMRVAGHRGQLFFNNPNQLGYYALLAACVIASAQRRLKLGMVLSSVALMGCAYLALVSASRAALIGIALLFVLLVFSNPRIIVIASLVVLATMALGGPLADAIDSAQSRMDEVQSRVGKSFAQERGYDRLWTYKEYLVIGAGEGETSRFSDPSKPQQINEIHSSAATILFSYGVVGSLLFIAFFYSSIRGAPIRLVVILIPTLGYTLAHQGLRFTMFWVLIIVFIIVKVPVRVPRSTARKQRVPRAPLPPVSGSPVSASPVSASGLRTV